MDLQDYRKQIDEIDDQLVKLFQQRMEVSEGIAAYKKERGLPILDAGREHEKINSVCAKVSPKCETTPRCSTPLFLSSAAPTRASRWRSTRN